MTFRTFAIALAATPMFAASTPVTYSLGSANDVAVDQATDSVYVTGTAPGAAGGLDLTLLKYDLLGNLLWSRSYGTASDDVGWAVEVNPLTHDVYVVGGVGTGAGVTRDAVVIRYSDAGVRRNLRKISFGAMADEEAFLLALDSAGNVFVAGATDRGFATDDIFVAQLTSTLTLTAQRWSGTVFGHDRPLALAANTTGVAVAGTATNIAGDLDGVVIRYDHTTLATAARQFIVGFAGENDEVRDVELDAAGNVYYAAKQWSSATDSHIIVSKTNNMLVANWTTVDNLSVGEEERPDRLIASGGSVYVGTSLFIPAPRAWDVMIYALDDATGFRLPIGPFGYHYVDSETLRDMTLTSAGKLVLTAMSDTMPWHTRMVAQLDAGSLGIDWIVRWGGLTSHNEPFAIAATSSGDAVVTGIAEVVGGFTWETERYRTSDGHGLW